MPPSRLKFASHPGQQGDAQGQAVLHGTGRQREGGSSKAGMVQGESDKMAKLGEPRPSKDESPGPRTKLNGPGASAEPGRQPIRFQGEAGKAVLGRRNRCPAIACDRAPAVDRAASRLGPPKRRGRGAGKKPLAERLSAGRPGSPRRSSPGTLDEPDPNVRVRGGRTENPFVPVRQGAALDLLDRRRHGLLRQRPPVPRRRNQLPPPDAVRIEEMLNYFPYDDAARRPSDDPFAVNVEVARCPWNAEHRLARIGLKGKPIDQRQAAAEQPRVPDRRLRLDGPAQQAAAGQGGAAAAGRAARRERPGRDRRLRRGLGPGPAARPRACTRPRSSRRIDQLQAGGSTNGGAGIQLAYDVAVAELHQGRHQPRDPRHRRRLQRRRHRPGRADQA